MNQFVHIAQKHGDLYMYVPKRKEEDIFSITLPSVPFTISSNSRTTLILCTPWPEYGNSSFNDQSSTTTQKEDTKNMRTAYMPCTEDHRQSFCFPPSVNMLIVI